ncbi:hypothetical protein OG264_36930 [Streptomyces xanthophaeus]|uniref:hypothetical protein n=1 Tax=Streptomyces xanthophaeus TaxID=67385 RepID=UPI003870C692|nr:hypothetical protein OG264_36930 [Streptomyces xanthophaeus]WST58408.1 hypothetical protein OG605_01505 [Streptomyces xanthophaeus]
MVNEPDTTPIHKQYAQRFSADLEINRKEQDELSAQIAELEARLKQLKADENWLCGVQGALPAAGAGKAAERVAAQAVRSPAAKTAKTATAKTAAAPAASAAEPVAGSVPKPRQAKKAAGATRARKATPAKKASGTAATGTKAKAAPRKPATTAAKTATTAAPAAAGATTTAATATTAAAAAAAKKDTGTKSPQAEPPLRELVLALLVGAAEPRLVSEVSTELAQAHPGRPASTQVVRNTLETLAKKNLIEKEHKQGSVMYSAPRPATTEPVAAAATATGTKDEKEPVKV